MKFIVITLTAALIYVLLFLYITDSNVGVEKCYSLKEKEQILSAKVLSILDKEIYIDYVELELMTSGTTTQSISTFNNAIEINCLQHQINKLNYSISYLRNDFYNKKFTK